MNNPHQTPSQQEQARYWDSWNADRRETRLTRRVMAQAALVLKWLERLGRRDLKIIDVGCGAGWLSKMLIPFGFITGIDITEAVLERARARVQEVRFITGNFIDEVFDEPFDVVVSLEVLSHVPDQSAFLRKCWDVLKPGGHLMLATQNKYVYERRDDIQPPAPAQIRNWVDSRRLRELLEVDFEILALTSLRPDGHRGLLRLVNSPRLNGMLSHVVSQERLDSVKERMLLGQTLMALARKPPHATSERGQPT